MVEAVEEPGGAIGFSEGRGGDADHFELPLAELGLVEVQPVEGAMDGGEGGEAGDAALGGGGHEVGSAVAVHQYSNLDEEEARAGAVGPAAERLWAARTSGMESAAIRPGPASTKVPTRLRTMWWRKPEPVTR